MQVIAETIIFGEDRMINSRDALIFEVSETGEYMKRNTDSVGIQVW